jgi:hypothetical protein
MQQSVEKYYKGTSNTKPETDGRDLSLWDRVLGLIKQDLVERCSRKVFVEVQGESASYRKEIGELSTAERRSLHPALREHVVEQLLDRYLAEQGRVDLVEKRRAYTKEVQDLTPEDLPALVGADRWRAEEYQKEHERAEFVQEMMAALLLADAERSAGGTLRE